MSIPDHRLGGIVAFRPARKGQVCAAIITDVHGDGVVSVAVFAPDGHGPYACQKIPYGPTTGPDHVGNTWECI